jgi:hypothetical protein
MTGAVALLAAAAVAIPGKYFSPSSVTVVAGDEVSWRNSDLDEHDVRAVDGSFDSGTLGRFGSFTVRFETAGARPYLCSLHPFMRGTVNVFGALLSGPGPVLAGERVRLEGRAAPGAAVALELRADDGGWPGVDRAVAAADGAFAFSVVASEGAVYRAVTVAGASPEVALAVTAGIDVRIAVHHGHLSVRTSPARPGLVAVLQRYSRERYMWRRVAHVRLSRRGRAGFELAREDGRVRVTIGRTVRGAALAPSVVVRVRDGRVVRDPAAPHGHDEGAPPAGHDGPSAGHDEGAPPAGHDGHGSAAPSAPGHP